MEELQKLQNKMFELMVEIDDICRNNGIVYYLHAGTALGAVRHRSFIPWDDDTDLILTRDNWEKFRKVFQDMNIPNRKLVCRENNPEHTYLFARYVDTNTTYSFRWKGFNTGEEGVAVDFIIFEEICNNPKVQQKYRKWMIVLGELVGRRLTVNPSGDIKLYLKIKKLERILGYDAVIHFIEKKMKKYSATGGDCYMQVAPHMGLNWICPAEYLKEPENIEINGHFFYAPTHVRSFLRKAYGDSWMMMPAIGERGIHSGIRSLTVPYRKAELDACHWVDKEKYDVCYIKQKSFYIRAIYYEQKIKKIDARIRCQTYALELDHKLNKIEKRLKILYKHNKYTIINSIFADYIEKQIGEMKNIDMNTMPSVEFMAPYVIKLSNKRLDMICLSLTLCGQYFIAQKILDLNFGINEKRPPDLQKTQELINISREWSIARYDTNNWNYIEEITHKWFSQYPYHVDFIYGHLFLKLKNTRKEAHIKEIIKETEKALVIHPNSVELLRIIADANLKLKLEKKAIVIYHEILKKSYNGMLNLEINDILLKLNAELRENEENKEEIKQAVLNNIKIQNKLLALLQEIDEICKEEHIPYFLGPTLTREAVEKQTLTKALYVNHIVMRPVDRKRFISAVCNKMNKDRAIDCIEVNEKYVDYSILYCDTSTICFDFRDGGLQRNNNICIEILFISPNIENRFLRKRNTLLFTAISNAATNIFIAPNIKHIVSGICGRILMIIFGESKIKKICWKWVYQPQNNITKIKGRIKTYHSKWYRLPLLDFSNPCKGVLNEIEYNIPSNYQKYIEVIEDAKDSIIGINLNNKNKLVAVSEAGNSNFLNNINSEVNHRLRYANKARKIRKKGVQYSSYIIRGWEYMQRSIIRLEMMNKYLPQKKQIMKLYSERQYIKLNHILDDYMRNIIIFAQKGLSIYFDPDIFRISWDLISRKGQGKFIENIIDKIPTIHVRREKK